MDIVAHCAEGFSLRARAQGKGQDDTFRMTGMDICRTCLPGGGVSSGAFPGIVGGIPAFAGMTGWWQEMTG